MIDQEKYENEIDKYLKDSATKNKRMPVDFHKSPIKMRKQSMELSEDENEMVIEKPKLDLDESIFDNKSKPDTGSDDNQNFGISW